MAYPDNFADKMLVACWNVAVAVANEGAVADHDKRINIAQQLARGGGSYNGNITIDFKAQGYDDATPVATMESRLAALIPTWINLGMA